MITQVSVTQKLLSIEKDSHHEQTNGSSQVSELLWDKLLPCPCFHYSFWACQWFYCTQIWDFISPRRSASFLLPTVQAEILGDRLRSVAELRSKDISSEVWLAKHPKRRNLGPNPFMKLAILWMLDNNNIRQANTRNLLSEKDHLEVLLIMISHSTQSNRRRRLLALKQVSQYGLCYIPRWKENPYSRFQVSLNTAESKIIRV